MRSVTYSPAQAARKLGVGRNKLLAWMRGNGLITACNAPTLAARTDGYLRTHFARYQIDGIGQRESIQPRITPKGMRLLRGRLTEAGLINPANPAND